METTRQAEFLKMYPDASKSKLNGVLEIFPCKVEKRSCDDGTSCFACKKNTGWKKSKCRTK